jgi:uroporphyrinogen-III synthase
MSFLEPEKYDLMVFFSPAGIKSLLKNFKNYKQKDRLIGVFGPNTAQVARESGLKLAIEAPNEKAPSMAKAIDHFLANNLKGK